MSWARGSTTTRWHRGSTDRNERRSALHRSDSRSSVRGDGIRGERTHVRNVGGHDVARRRDRSTESMERSLRSATQGVVSGRARSRGRRERRLSVPYDRRSSATEPDRRCRQRGAWRWESSNNRWTAGGVPSDECGRPRESQCGVHASRMPGSMERRGVDVGLSVSRIPVHRRRVRARRAGRGAVGASGLEKRCVVATHRSNRNRSLSSFRRPSIASRMISAASKLNVIPFPP